MTQRNRRELPVIEDSERPGRSRPGARADSTGGPRSMTPLQAELLEEGTLPQADELGTRLRRADCAPEAGYFEGRPVETAAPEAAAAERYEGWPPVLQWDIDPADPSRASHQAHLALGNWEYDVWWQRHAAGLRYASIQALARDPVSGGEREPPLGRNVVVNLVYDERRSAVTAIYGTARDFRPFVEAFRRACGLEPATEECER